MSESFSVSTNKQISPGQSPLLSGVITVTLPVLCCDFTVTLCLSLCGSKAGAGRHLAAAGVSAAISDLCICDPVTQSFSVKLIVTRD